MGRQITERVHATQSSHGHAWSIIPFHFFLAIAPISISLLAGDGLPDSRPESCSALLELPREFPVGVDDDAPPPEGHDDPEGPDVPEGPVDEEWGDDDDDADEGFNLTTDDEVEVVDRSVFFTLPTTAAAGRRFNRNFRLEV